MRNDCLHRWRQTSAPRVTVYAIPHAGAGASAVRGIAHAAPAWLDVVAVRLPGRENRFSERPHASMTQAVSEITEAIGADRSRAAHFGVYGQSWGAALALETAAALIESPELVGLIVASAAPPFPAPLSPPQTRAEARAYITALGGVAQEIQENDELMSLVLEIVEHDFQLARGYVRSPLPKSAPPLLALRGEQDRALSRADFKKWDKFTTRATLSEIPGNHFLLSNPEGIASELARFLARQTFLGDDADGGRASASPARSHGS